MAIIDHIFQRGIFLNQSPGYGCQVLRSRHEVCTSICVARESIISTLASFVRIPVWRTLVVRVENLECRTKFSTRSTVGSL